VRAAKGQAHTQFPIDRSAARQEGQNLYGYGAAHAGLTGKRCRSAFPSDNHLVRFDVLSRGLPDISQVTGQSRAHRHWRCPDCAK
jgi:hypothetical protein